MRAKKAHRFLAPRGREAASTASGGAIFLRLTELLRMLAGSGHTLLSGTGVGWRAVKSLYFPVFWHNLVDTPVAKRHGEAREMRPPTSPEISEILAHWGHGDRSAREALIPLVYDELRRIARRHLRGERPDHTLQSAALVHEAYFRLLDIKAVPWQNRAHFFGVAAQLMRHILVDHARNRLAAKRGGGAQRITLDTKLARFRKPEIDLVALDDALNALAALDPQQSRIIEMRFFGGLSIEETATVLDISPATVKREWATARAWLQREMNRERGK